MTLVCVTTLDYPPNFMGIYFWAYVLSTYVEIFTWLAVKAVSPSCDVTFLHTFKFMEHLMFVWLPLFVIFYQHIQTFTDSEQILKHSCPMSVTRHELVFFVCMRNLHMFILPMANTIINSVLFMYI